MAWPNNVNVPWWNLATMGMGSLMASYAFRSLWKTSKQTIKVQYLLLDIAKKSIPIDPSHVDEANEGKIVHVVGRLLAGKKISDPYFSSVEFSPFILFLKRVIEMYQWNEEKFDCCPHVNFKVFYYGKNWYEGRIPSEKFHYPSQERTNPSPPLSSLVLSSESMKLGEFHLSKEVTDEIPRYISYKSPKFHSENEIFKNSEISETSEDGYSYFRNDISKNFENSTNFENLENSENSKNGDNSKNLENSKNGDNSKNFENSLFFENSKNGVNSKNGENSKNSESWNHFSEIHETNSVNGARDSLITESTVDGGQRKQNEIGDIRVKFQVIEGGNTVSILAKQVGNNLVPFTIQNQKSLSMVVLGEKTTQEICQIYRKTQTLGHTLTNYFSTLFAIFGTYLITASIIQLMPALFQRIGGQSLLCSFSLGTTLSAWVVATAWFTCDPLFSMGLYGLGALTSGVIFNKIM